MSDQKVKFFKAKSGRKLAIRKNEKPIDLKSDEHNESSDSSEIELTAPSSSLAKSRRQIRGRNLICTSSKKARRDMEANRESSSEDDEQTKFDLDMKYSSSNTADRYGSTDMGATARNEIDTEADKDAQAQFERIQGQIKKQKISAEQGLEEGATSSKIYRGMALYGAKEKEDTVKGNASSGLNRHGPIRATQFMRASVRWDFAPDICKDYKETGYCTFGDSCKFMHDRTDYKHGWEIERDWEAGKLKEAKEDEFLISSEGEDDDDKLPFSCFICRDSFKNPVSTKCKHYFCEKCAVEQYRKTKRCAACNEKTDGVFNIAREIIRKMKAQAYKESLNSLRDPDNDDEDVDNETTSVTETIMNRDENYHENPDELNADKSDNDGSKESD